MRKICSVALFIVIAVVLTTPAFAQSSGNFTADVNMTTCVMDNDTGSFGETGIVLPLEWTTKIKVPNGNGTALIIRPSYVTGILTTTRLQSGIEAATSSAGIQVCVDLDQGKINGSEDPVCVMYDKRFQQLKSNLFTSLLQDCDLVTDGIQSCYLELTLSTLGAHSFDFVAHDIPGGERTVTVNVKFVDVNNAGGDAAVCVGPGTVTVTQTKVFSTSDGIEIQ